MAQYIWKIGLISTKLYNKHSLFLVASLRSITGNLTHLPLYKMAAILTDNILNCIFLNENDRILIQISLKYVPKSQINSKPELVQVMAWCRTGNKPLPEPMMTQFIDAYTWH